MFTKIDKEKLDNYFNELAKIYKKESHGYLFELILVGGASILINYNFRDMTNDIDALFLNSDIIKDCIKKVSEEFNLSPQWINDDFKTTKSFSNKLYEFSSFYKTYKNILTIRTIKDEYLIAMKLVSGRIYKNDISDIIGIINESKKSTTPISYEMIDKAMNNLYGGWELVDKNIIDTLNKILESKNLDEIYNKTIIEENKTQTKLIDLKNNSGININERNIDDILKMLE